MEDVAEAIVTRDLLELRARVGHSDEALASFFSPYDLLDTFEEVLLEDVGLERGSRFARNDEQSVLQVNLLFEGLDLRRIGGIEYDQFREALYSAEGHLQHFGAEARTAHA